MNVINLPDAKYPRPYLRDLALIAAWAVGMILIGLFIASLAASAAEAAPLHQHRSQHAHRVLQHASSHRHHGASGAVVARDTRPAVGWSFGGFGSSLVAEARSQLGNGAVYGRSNLWCARFTNWVLEHTGHRGTGSDMAASFAHYGRRVPGPEVGSIAVMSRRGGGHVGIVSGLDASGNPIIISGNHNGRVREAVYPRRRIYAYVLPI